MEILQNGLFGFGLWLVCFVLAMVLPVVVERRVISVAKAAAWACLLSAGLALTSLAVCGVQFAFGAEVIFFGNTIGVVAVSALIAGLLQLTGKAPYFFN